jgi:hypothetical protein
MGTKKDFIKKIVKNPDFWVRFDAISTGVSVSVESGLLVAGAFLPAVPFLLGALALAGASVLGTCALYSLFIGVKGTLEVLKDTWHDTFRPGKPKPLKSDKPKSTPIDRIAHHRLVYPWAKKIAQTKLGKRLVNSNIGQKLRYGLTQQQRDIFMCSLNTKGSLFTGGAAMTYIVMHMLSLPALTLGGIATVPVFIASLYAGKSAFDITQSSRVLFKHIRNWRAERKKKKGAAKTPAPVPVPAPQPAPAPVPVLVAASAFDKAAAPVEKKVEATPAIIAPPPAPPSKPSIPPPAA